MSKHSDAAIVSAISGVALVDFGEIHAVIEELAGGPVWTHQIPSVIRSMKPNAAKAFPDLAAIDVSGVNRDTFEAWKHEHPDLFTTGREIKPLGDFTRPPLDGLDQSKTIIVERRR
jgi:hypothetical protein